MVNGKMRNKTNKSLGIVSRKDFNRFLKIAKKVELSRKDKWSNEDLSKSIGSGPSVRDRSFDGCEVLQIYMKKKEANTPLKSAAHP